LKSINSILKIVIPLLLGAIFVWISLSKTSIQTIVGYFKDANYYWIFLGISLGIFSHLSRAYRWKYMIEPLGYKLRISNSIMAVFSGYLINYTIPRAGEISRATIISKYEKIPFEKGIGTIVAERVADIVAMLIVISIALVLEFNLIFDFFSKKINSNNLSLIYFLIPVIILIILYLFVRRTNNKFFFKIKSLIDGFVQGLLSILKMNDKWLFIAHTLFIWAMYVLMFYVTSFSVNFNVDVPFSVILIGFISASFTVAATNGGLGLYPEAVTIAFSSFFIDHDPSRAFGWIMWTSQTVMIVVIGVICLIFLPRFNKINPKIS